MDELKYSYYPGCTLKTKAKDLDAYARESALALGVELEEIDEWQCCGTVYPQARDEIATRLSSVRILDKAKQKGQDLITLCSACHNVVKRVNRDIQTDADIRDKVNAYLALEQAYEGETRVKHYLEMLRDDVGFDTVRQRAANPLTGQKIAAYYGCLLLRPSDEMAFDDPENPSIMEDFIAAIGAEPVVYPYRNECCGAYVSINDEKMPERMCGNIISSALENGAEAIVTACPLCFYNLEKNNGGRIKVYYFTELLARALGLKHGMLMQGGESDGA